MSATATLDPPRAETTAPVDAFSDSHASILAGLRLFAGLPALQEAAQRARRVAAQTLALMDDSVLRHHADEEQGLFAAVLASARRGEERDRVESLVVRLAAQHREIEALWKALRADVLRSADGKEASLDGPGVRQFVERYGAHATLEEAEFLPLAREILGRNGNHMAALALSIHLRHAPRPVGYI